MEKLSQVKHLHIGEDYKHRIQKQAERNMSETTIPPIPIQQTEEEKKLEGIRIAAANTPLFQEKVLILIRQIPVGNRFTISKIRKACDDTGIVNTGHPNAWGAAMRVAALCNLIRKVQGEYLPSRTPGCHRRPVQVWERI